MNPLQQAELAQLQHRELLRQMREQRWAREARQPSWWRRLWNNLQHRPQLAPQPGLKLAASK